MRSECKKSTTAVGGVLGENREIGGSSNDENATFENETSTQTWQLFTRGCV